MYKESANQSMLKVNFDIPLDFLWAKTPPLIGVDISASSIKMVELSELPKKKGSYTIERYAIELLPKDAITDGNINNLEAVSDGPWFYTQLPAGTYYVEVQARGTSQRQVVQVVPQRQTQRHFAWHGF